MCGRRRGIYHHFFITKHLGVLATCAIFGMIRKSDGKNFGVATVFSSRYLRQICHTTTLPEPLLIGFLEFRVDAPTYSHNPRTKRSGTLAVWQKQRNTNARKHLPNYNVYHHFFRSRQKSPNTGTPNDFHTKKVMVNAHA